jgi:C-terminal processing protease CtpA/Prc
MSKQLLILFSLLFLLIGCEDKKEVSIKESIENLSEKDLGKSFAFETMKIAYYWNKSLPDKVDYQKYDTPQDLIDELRHPIDKWSFIEENKVVKKLFNDSKTLGWGMRLLLGNKYVYIYEVYKDSDFYRNGITNRGWKLLTVNGDSINAYNFKNKLNNKPVGYTANIELELDGNYKKIEAIYEDHHINTVDYVKTFNYKNNKIGYFYFNKYIDSSSDELDDTFAKFKSEEINNLIIDLRNNGGGLVHIAEKLCKYISGKHLNSKVLHHYKFNDDLSYLDNDSYFSKESPENTLNLQKVYVLTSSWTASASELTINTLREAGIEVITCGNTTTGKAYGMYGMKSTNSTNLYKSFGRAFYDYTNYAERFTEVDYILNAINFKSGDYTNGISPNHKIFDDYLTPYGNTKEPLLRKAINIINGTTTISKKLGTNKYKLPELKGFDRLKGGFI